MTPNFRNHGRKGNIKTSTRIRKGNAAFGGIKSILEQMREQKEKFNQDFIAFVERTHQDGSIDYSKFGWVQKLADALHETPQVSGRRVRNLMPQFYVDHCFYRGKKQIS
jgi:hypothetical protein